MTDTSNGHAFHHSTFFTDGGRVRKIIEPDLIKPEEIENQRGILLEYRRRLMRFGIPVAAEYELVTDNNQLAEVTTHCGTDGYAIIKTGGMGNLSPRMVVSQIVDVLGPLLAQQPTMETTIDPHPANWCFSPEGMRYIDFHPARFYHKGQYLVGFPQPPADGAEYQFSVSRYYDPLGIIRSLRFSAVRAGGRQMEDAVLSAMKVYPGTLRAHLHGCLLELPDWQLRSGGNFDRIIGKLDAWQVDSIREIAMLAADMLEREQAEQFLNLILDLTRVDFNLSLADRSARVEEAKKSIADVWYQYHAPEFKRTG